MIDRYDPRTGRGVIAGFIGYKFERPKAPALKKVGYEFHDGGRKAAGYRGKTGDCVCRALAIISGRDYRECYIALARANKASGRRRSARNGVKAAVYSRVFAEFGLQKVKQGRGPKHTLSTAYRIYGDCIVSTAKHLLAIKDGAVRDTFDSRFHHFHGYPEERKAMSIWVRK